MPKTINQRIAFEGGKQMEDQLKSIGQAGKEAMGQLRSGLERGSEGFKQLQQQMKVTGQQLQQLGSRFQKVGRSMSLYITAPLTGIGVAAVRTAASFEKGLANISTIIDRNAESIDDIKSGLLDLSTRVPVSLGELTEAMYQVRSAGISAADAFGVLEESAKLGVAGLGTTTEAVDLVTSALNAFSDQNLEASKVANSLFLAVKNGKTTISELAQGFGRAAPVAANAGIAFNEFVAAATAITTGGVKASEAFTGIRSAIAGLTGQTKEAKEIFDALGVDSFKQLIKEEGGLVAAFKRIRTVVGENDTQLQKAIGGAEGFAAVAALSGAQAERFALAMQDMQESATALDEAFAVQSDTLSANLQYLSNATAAFGVALGDALTPAIKAAAQALTFLAQSLAAMPQWLATVVALVGSLVAAAGPAVFIFGSLLKVFGGLLPVLARMPGLLAAILSVTTKLGPAFIALRTAALAFTATPVGLAITAIVLALTAFITILSNTEDGWTNFVDNIKGGIDVVVSAFNSMLDFAKNTFDGIVEFLRPVIDGVRELGSALSSVLGLAGGGEAAAAQGFASGGRVRGPGTGTSDSILARLSNGEFVQRAAAVRYYGADFMHAINRMAIPRGTLAGLAGFANGGLVHALAPLRDIPRFAAGGLAEAGVGGSQRPITLQIGAESIGGLSASEDAFTKIQKLSTRKTLSSGGVKPTWYR